jgi:hypothetical protein
MRALRDPCVQRSIAFAVVETLPRAEKEGHVGKPRPSRPDVIRPRSEDDERQEHSREELRRQLERRLAELAIRAALERQRRKRT